jgi:hypothetical protein
VRYRGERRALSVRRSHTDQSPEPNVAVYKPAPRGRRPREGVPNLRRRLRLHAHLLHESVEEVFSFPVGIGLEPATSVWEDNFSLAFTYAMMAVNDQFW